MKLSLTLFALALTIGSFISPASACVTPVSASSEDIINTRMMMTPHISRRTLMNNMWNSRRVIKSTVKGF